MVVDGSKRMENSTLSACAASAWVKRAGVEGGCYRALLFVVCAGCSNVEFGEGYTPRAGVLLSVPASGQVLRIRPGANGLRLDALIDGRFLAVEGASPGPPSRLGFAATYDAKGDRVLVFGGLGEEVCLDDVWSFESGAWRPVPTGPPGRVEPLFWYDASAELVRFVGGTVGCDVDPEPTEWTLDDETWRPMEGATR